MNTHKIVFATGNQGKVLEIKEIMKDFLEKHNVELHSLKEEGIKADEILYSPLIRAAETYAYENGVSVMAVNSAPNGKMIIASIKNRGLERKDTASANVCMALL